MTMNFTGIFLVICSGLLLSGGAVIGGCAGWSLFHFSHHFWTTQLGAELGSAVLVAAACALCFPACWLAAVVPSQPRCTALHGTLMALLLGATVLLTSGLAAAAALGRELQKEGLVAASMQQALARYDLDPAYRSAFARMQLELHCCGVTSPRDWYKHRAELPASCCGPTADGDKRGEAACREPRRPGCLRPALAQLRGYTTSVTILGYCLVVVLAATMFATAHLTAHGLLERPEPGLKMQPLRLACVATTRPRRPRRPHLPALGGPVPAHDRRHQSISLKVKSNVSNSA